MLPQTVRVLVVDDSAAIRVSICELLRDLGFGRVDEAADGVQALERFEAEPPDVVITDWNMPHKTGLELLQAIRSSAARAQTPVLILTGEVTEERVRQAVEAGANGFIAKPMFTQALIQKLTQVVGALSANAVHA
jgi:two-component system, chemotaxis family, chemotaxis protein CheY